MGDGMCLRHLNWGGDVRLDEGLGGLKNQWGEPNAFKLGMQHRETDGAGGVHSSITISTLYQKYIQNMDNK